MRCSAALLLLLLIQAWIGSSGEDFQDRCEVVVKTWAEQELWLIEDAVSRNKDQHKWELKDLLFFLHIPRTGGRNYNQCFLKNLFSRESVCPRSYDKLRFDPRRPSCVLLSTHDDYSILTRLPRKTTSTVTTMRNPTSRVLSTYEFSVEVAARFLNRKRLTFKEASAKALTNSMSTLDIWPWKHLVPIIRKDLFARRDLRQTQEFKLSSNPNVYDVPSHVMPLKDFIEHPIVLDIVHNGATFQVAGITENSCIEDASLMRRCVRDFENLGSYVLNVAKRRLDEMLYVGLTEKHRDSAEAFAHLVGRQVIMQRAQSPSRNFSGADELQISNTTAEAPTTYEGLMDQLVSSYSVCSDNMRSTQEHRRIVSLVPVAPVNFTKKAREAIPSNVLARISQLNSLDFDLYQHAIHLFRLQEEFVQSKLLLNSSQQLQEQQQQQQQQQHRVIELHSIGIVIVIPLLTLAVGINFFFRSFFRTRLRFSKSQL